VAVWKKIAVRIFFKDTVQYRPKKSECSFFSKAQFNVYFFVFNFQDFILCVELIFLQSSLLELRKKCRNIFLK
jgi:hypothetical protein